MPNGTKENELLDCGDALQMVLQQCASAVRFPPMETVELGQANGRVLAETVIADRDQPPFDRSTRDGFAVRATEASNGIWLRQRGTLRAGEIWRGPATGAGECIEIMTGAPLPTGADAVVMLEHVQHSGDTVRLIAGKTLAPGENVVARASEAHAGDVLIEAGTRFTAAEIALAASAGCAQVKVYRRPRIAVLAAGDELVDISQKPATQQIRNSNSYGIAALIENAGGEAWCMPLVRDSADALRDAIAESREADLLILSGGVSAGKYDFAEAALATHGATFFFTGVKMQPGKPVVFGCFSANDNLPKQYFFGLPGNPVSTQVTTLLFVLPMVRALAGERRAGPEFVSAALEHDVNIKPGLTRFLPATMSGTLTETKVALTGWQGSGDLAANSRANCYAVIPPDAEKLAAGTSVQLLLR